MRNHTGTHLLHAALRKVLGTHVKQAGSVVEPSRLRFDFTHYAALDADEIAEVERLMNEEILANVEVHTDVMDLDQALQTGAMALFGEKYGDKVRVVSIDTIQQRTVRRNARLAAPATSASARSSTKASISAGVRRIEAITGEGALRRFQEAQSQLARVAGASSQLGSQNWSSRLKSCWTRRRRSSTSCSSSRRKLAQARPASSKAGARRSRA